MIFAKAAVYMKNMAENKLLSLDQRIVRKIQKNIFFKKCEKIRRNLKIGDFTPLFMLILCEKS
jgi:hypothetical protein